MTDSRKSPKRTMTKRMWGAFDPATGKLWRETDGLVCILGSRAELNRNMKRSSTPYVLIAVTVTWSAPNKRKAKR